MKANELMVGDFVKVNRDVCIKNGTIVEIRAIDADNAFIEKGLKGCATCVNINDHCEFGGVWVDFLEPIPLTPEILEKNGFVKAPMVSDTPPYDKDEEGNMHFSLNGNFWGWWQQNQTFLIPANGLGWLEFKYLHQLQHALKLCGIEKSIEL